MNRKQNSGKAIPKKRVAYILAASHSGSTLTAMLLNSHPNVCTIGEIKATSFGNTDQYRCSCLNKIKDCNFWTAVSKDLATRGLDFDITDAGTDVRSGTSAYVRRLLRPLHRGPLLELCRDVALSLTAGWRTHVRHVQRVNSELIASVLERTQSKVIVDSSKIGIRLKYLLRNPALDVKIVRVIRDGRGVALTYVDPERYADARDEKLRGGGMGANRESERLTMAQAAHEWRRSNEEAEAILGQLDKSQWTAIHYEELCRNTEETLKGVFSFLGVNPDKNRPDFRSVEHHIIGNGMRLNSSSEIKQDDRWKSVLSSSDIKIFDDVAGELNRKMGYR